MMATGYSNISTCLWLPPVRKRVSPSELED
jgi:hypothetical protein